MDESTRHRETFNEYVRLGPHRSIEKLQDALRARGRAPSLRTLYSWSSTFHWRERLLDLERDAREQDRIAHLETLRDMNERQRKEGLALQQKGIEKLGRTTPEQMSPAEAIRALIEGVKIERLALGAPTEHVLQEGVHILGHVDLTGFSNEELRRLAEIADRRLFGAGEEEP